MDMKKFLQAVDGIATKPVEGSASMARFLRVVKEDDNIKARAKAAFDELDNPDTELKTSSDAEIRARLAAQKGKGTKLNDMNPLDRDQWLKSTGQYWDTATQTVKPLPVKENSLSKFLSIVRNNNVDILKEGAGPHRVALPVQMAMQHYQQHTETPQPRERLIDKYFTEAEAAITQRKEEKRALINQYASVIAERVLMKESKKKILNEGDLEVLKPDGKSDDYNSVQFRFDGKTVERGSEDFDYYYKLVFNKNPPGGKDDFIDTLKGMMDKDYGSMGADPMKDSENDVQNGDVIIPSHPKPKGKWVKISDIVEAGSNAIDTVAKRLTDPKDGMTAKLRAAGDKRREDKLKGRNISRRDTTSKDEWGDLKELSTELLGNYKKAAGADAKTADAAGDYARGDKRFKGINRATIKQFDNDAKKHKELDEADAANPMQKDPAQFAKPPPVPQVPPEDGMYGSWEFTTRKDGDRSATHPQLGTFVWDNSGAGGAMRPITWSITSNALPGMSWVTDFVSGTHTLEATGKLASGNLEYQGKMQTKLDGTPVSGSVGLKGYGHDANYTADYANNKTVGTATGHQVKQEGLEQLLALRNKIDEAIQQLNRNYGNSK